jgi:hypothetical protein
MKLKEPEQFKDGATMEQYNEWRDTLPAPVFNYWFCSAMLKRINMGVINEALKYPEYFTELDNTIPQ